MRHDSKKSSLFPNVLQGRPQRITALEKTCYATTCLFALLAAVTLDSAVGPQPTFNERFDWHGRGYFGEYGGSRMYF